jgi:methyl-accepting chemotaxis protein
MFQTEAMIACAMTQLVGLMAGYSLVLGIVRQSAAISQTLAKINNGDFEARAETISADELGDAASALNTMCDSTLNLIQSNDERDQIQVSIENLISEMKGIAAGDLTITTEVNHDITGAIAASVNHMTEQLRVIVRQVKSAAEQVTTSSTRIRESSTAMSEETDAQATRIEDASNQLAQMTGSFQEVAALTKESVQAAIEARKTASNGLQAVSDTVDGMRRIRDQVQSTSKRIKRLGESSQEIGEIVQLISDITDRTSILALNASIQAAMAGDAGQGFAVVAEEIERLAESSKDATKQISKLIRAIQNGTGEVILDMEESTREVVAGSHLASKAGVTLYEIDTVSNQLVELIQNSSAYALEQAETATKVADSMLDISMSTKASAEKSREATRSVGRLAEMVGQLKESVSQFKVDDVPREDNASSCKSGWSETQYPSTRETPVDDQVRSEPARRPVSTHPFRVLNDPPAKGFTDSPRSNSPSSPPHQTAVAQTMVITEKNAANASGKDDPETERDFDENLLRQLREAQALLNKTEASTGSENPSQPDVKKAARQPTRTIMWDDISSD